MKNAKVIFHNLTQDQAETLASWFDGQGEQDADIWFDAQGVKSPYVDSQRKGGGIVVDGDTVNVYIK